MAESDSSQAVFKSNAERLARLMKLDETTPDIWSKRDLVAMLRHQMAAPLHFDLSSVELNAAGAKARDENLAGAVKQRINSFKDLLFHPEPPLDLLRLSKDFFKRRVKTCKKGSPEWQIAYLFYLLSILAASARRESISTLTAAELRKGVRWVLAREWVDARTKAFVVGALGQA